MITIFFYELTYNNYFCNLLRRTFKPDTSPFEPTTFLLPQNMVHRQRLKNSLCFFSNLYFLHGSSTNVLIVGFTTKYKKYKAVNKNYKNIILFDISSYIFPTRITSNYREKLPSFTKSADPTCIHTQNSQLLSTDFNIMLLKIRNFHFYQRIKERK